MTTEARNAPAPRLVPAPPPPRPRGLGDPVLGVREPTRRSEAPGTRSPGSGWSGAASPRAVAEEAAHLEPGCCPNAPSPILYFPGGGVPFPPSLPFAVRGKRAKGRGVTWKVYSFLLLVTTGSAEEILPPSLEAWNLHRQGFLLHVSCLCCADGNFRNMPPSRRGRERLAQSSETPMVSGLPGPGAVGLGFPLSARGSCIPPRNWASPGSS